MVCAVMKVAARDVNKIRIGFVATYDAAARCSCSRDDGDQNVKRYLIKLP